MLALGWGAQISPAVMAVELWSRLLFFVWRGGALVGLSAVAS